MIYYDITEARKKSLLPQAVIDYGQPYPNFEALTGADFIIIPELSLADKIRLCDTKLISEIAKELGLPIKDIVLNRKDTETILMEYLFAGCVLVQRKSGMDFVNSFTSERLNESLAKMNETTHKQYQRLILVTGQFGEQDGLLTLNNKLTNYQYWTFKMAESSIWLKGGCVEFLPNDNLILEWIKYKEKQLYRYKREGTKWVISTAYYPPDLPDLDDLLQLPIVVRDARKTLVTIPGVGTDRANKLWFYLWNLNNNIPPTCLELLHYATSWETAKHVDGWGAGTIKKCRDWLGLQGDEYLCKGNNNVTVQRENNSE